MAQNLPWEVTLYFWTTLLLLTTGTTLSLLQIIIVYLLKAECFRYHMNSRVRQREQLWNGNLLMVIEQTFTKEVDFEIYLADLKASTCSYAKLLLLRCFNPAALPLVHCYSIRLPRRVASWVDYSRHELSLAQEALCQWSQPAEGWCTMMWKTAVFGNEPTTVDPKASMIPTTPQRPDLIDCSIHEPYANNGGNWEDKTYPQGNDKVMGQYISDAQVSDRRCIDWHSLL
jgi:hypothetical protein